jgi:hypothetical protein
MLLKVHTYLNFKTLVIPLLLHLCTMNQPIQEIKKASEGLLFISETDHPFEIVELKEGNNIEEMLLQLTGKAPGPPIETQTLDHFFRNHIKSYETDTDEQKQNIRRFIQLKNVLNEHLSNIKVYRIGEVQVDAFIIGQLKNGKYAGLRTKLVET